MLAPMYEVVRGEIVSAQAHEQAMILGNLWCLSQDLGSIEESWALWELAGGLCSRECPE